MTTEGKKFDSEKQCKVRGGFPAVRERKKEERKI
jgi:hypothetical protein